MAKTVTKEQAKSESAECACVCLRQAEPLCNHLTHHNFDAAFKLTNQRTQAPGWASGQSRVYLRASACHVHILVADTVHRLPPSLRGACALSVARNHLDFFL